MPIKVKARLIVRRGSEILLEMRHGENGDPFYRPLGGKVELGETSRAAVIRECYEEIHSEVEDLRYLGCLEDIRTTSTGIEHEVCFVYEGIVREQAVYQTDRVAVTEDVRRYTAYWMPLAYFQEDRVQQLRPQQLLSLLVP